MFFFFQNCFCCAVRINMWKEAGKCLVNSGVKSAFSKKKNKRNESRIVNIKVSLADIIHQPSIKIKIKTLF